MRFRHFHRWNPSLMDRTWFQQISERRSELFLPYFRAPSKMLSPSFFSLKPGFVPASRALDYSSLETVSVELVRKQSIFQLKLTIIYHQQFVNASVVKISSDFVIVTLIRGSSCHVLRALSFLLIINLLHSKWILSDWVNQQLQMNTAWLILTIFYLSTILSNSDYNR